MLTEMRVRKAITPEKNTKIYDALGLYLVLTPAGGKLWRFDYRFGGKRKTLALGKYPTVKLATARQLRDEARQQLDEGGWIRQRLKRWLKIRRNILLQRWHASGLQINRWSGAISTKNGCGALLKKICP